MNWLLPAVVGCRAGQIRQESGAIHNDTLDGCIVTSECIRVDPLTLRLLEHLKALMGQSPDLATEKATGLPLFMRQRYEVFSATMFGRRFLLAVEKAEQETESPGGYQGHAETIRRHLGESVVLVLPILTSYARNRLVRLGIPFVVPGSQLFLPMAMIDLRERFSTPKALPRKRLTPAAQCLILYHLQREPLEHLPLREIAIKIGYSPIMLTKVKNELETAGLCNASRQGRSISLAFKLKGRHLWDRAQPLLSSPARKACWLEWDRPGDPTLAAGITALSQLTELSDDRLPTCAMLSATLQAGLDSGIYRECQGAEEASLCMESWSYDPRLLANDHRVDPLSLYLSLRDSPDERVQLQLETLIAEIQW